MERGKRKLLDSEKRVSIDLNPLPFSFSPSCVSLLPQTPLYFFILIPRVRSPAVVRSILFPTNYFLGFSSSLLFFFRRRAFLFVVVVPSSFSISPSSCVRFLLLFFFLRFTSRYVSFFCVRYLEVSSGIFCFFCFCARVCRLRVWFFF